MTLKLSITVVHDKTPQENEAQLRALLPLVVKITDPHTDPDTGETFDTYHYQLAGLSVPHEVRFYQVLPYGVAQPPSFYLLDSHNVLYGPEDAQKGKARFFNWGLKRGADHGADVSLYLEDAGAFDPAGLEKTLEKLADKADAAEYAEHASGKLATAKLLKDVGQLDEEKGYSQAISEYKGKATAGEGKKK